MSKKYNHSKKIFAKTENKSVQCNFFFQLIDIGSVIGNLVAE